MGQQLPAGRGDQRWVRREMWAVARTIVVWIFGDDAIKYTLYVVVGVIVLMVVELSAVTTAIMSQPFGQWQFTGRGGAAVIGSESTPEVGSPRVPVPTVVPLPGPQLGGIERLIANAATWLGVHYLWGGCTHSGVDCSCFVQNVFASVGVRLPRTTVDQIRVAAPIAASQAEAGDLVFFDNTCTDCGANPTHVGLYLGDGRMIDAGDPVTIERVFAGHNARYGRVL